MTTPIRTGSPIINGSYSLPEEDQSQRQPAQVVYVPVPVPMSPYDYYNYYWTQQGFPPPQPQQPLPWPGMPPGGCFPSPDQFPEVNTQPQQPDPAAIKAQERQQFQQACTTLAQHFGDMGAGWFDGCIDMNAIAAAARGEKGPEAQKAAQFLMAHPDLMNELDTAKEGGKADGKISLGDINSELHTLSREETMRTMQANGQLPELQRHLQALLANREALDKAADFFGGVDGKISRDDLNAVLNNPKYPQDLRDAAAYFLSHDSALGLLDTAAKGGENDGIVSWDDLAALNRQIQNAVSTMPAPMKTKFISA